jgi:membrane fusion protein (multidrug efflux system)
MRALWTTATILALAAALAACTKKDGEAVEKKPPPPPVKVVLAPAAEGDSLQQLVLTGTVAAKQRSEVTADTAGKVLAVRVERGDRVKMGQPLIWLDVQSAALGAREAQANLANARAQRALAEQECTRTQQLLEKGAITRSEFDRQSTQCTSALQQVSAAEARAQMMMKTVADGQVRAPFAGVVSQKAVSIGEFVSPGRPLFTLVDDDPLRIELSVPEAAVLAIQPGQEVQLEAVAQPGKKHKAKVTRIGAEIGRTRALIVEAEIEAGSGLVPGMFAEATLTTGRVKRAVVPKGAVVRRGKSWHVFVVKTEKDDKGERKTLVDSIVQIAPAVEPDKIAIVRGVEKTDKVVIIDEAQQKKLADEIDALKKQVDEKDKAIAEVVKKKDEARKAALEGEKKPLREQIEKLENQLIADGRLVVE